jgi:hypothetical protein
MLTNILSTDVLRDSDTTGSCSSDAPDLYLGGAWFEFRAGQPLFLARIFVVFFSHVIKMPVQYIYEASPAFIQIFSKSLLAEYPTIRRRSQWPHGLRHELSLLAPKLGSWVRIPFKVWMPVFILCLC